MRRPDCASARSQLNAFVICYREFYAPAMIMAGALSVTPVRPSVRPYTVRSTYVRNYVRLSRRRPLSNSNIFYQNFMKLGHIV